MTTAYTPILKLALPVTGELNGTWGDVVNNNITSMVEQAVAGLATINTWTANSHTLTTADGTTSESRCAMLVIDDDGAGNPSAAATVICPTATKSYIVRNLCGQTVTVKTSAGTGVAVPNNQAALVFCDGTNVVTGAFNGDVVGPASATNNAIVTFDGTTGKLIQNNSGATISAGVVTATGFSGPLNGSVGATTPSTVVATQVDITAQGDLRLQDTTGGEYVALQAPATIATSYTLTLPVDDGTSGQALITDGSGVLSWSTAASGDVYGPASATDNAVARYDGTTGKIIQNSAVTIADDGATVIAVNSSSDGLRITQTGAGNALLVEDSANPDATPFVITNDGFVNIGTLSTQLFRSNFYGALNIVGTGYSPSSSLHFGRFNAGTGGAGIEFNHSRSGTVGTNTVLQSGDILGQVLFNGADGTSYITGAQVTAEVDGTPGTNDMPGRLVFSTTADGASSPTEAMRIDNAGRVGIGGAAGTDTVFGIYGNARSTSATNFGVRSFVTVPSTNTTRFTAFESNAVTQAASFTLTNYRHFVAAQDSIGAGSSITSQFGFYAENNLTGATNNYGFFSNIASGTGRWNFYAAGTANNYFGGNVGIGITTPAASLSVGGSIRVGSSDTADYSEFANNGTSNYWNSITDPISIFTAGSERVRIDNAGTISLGATPGSESLRVTPVASAVNYLQVNGNVTGAAPYLSSQGSDTNVNLGFLAKGTGSYDFWTGSFNRQFAISHTASAVNYLQVTGAATGASTTLSAQGTDTNVDITLTPKGSGYVVVDAAYSPNLTLTDAATITWDTSTAGGQVATFTFVSSNRTMGAPTNLKNGGFYALAVIQNAGSNTLTFNSVFKWAGGVAPTLSTAAGARDYFTFRSDGTNLYQQGISQAVA